MQVLHKQQNDTLIVFLMGELDEHTSAYTRDKLDKLLNDSSCYQTIAENGYSFVKTNYDWEEIGKQLEEVMNEDITD